MEETWLVDLSRGDNWAEVKPRCSRERVNKSRWTTEEVMYYYGEWIGSEKFAKFIMEDIERRIRRFRSVSFTHRMNMVRDYLMYKMGIKDIPFILNYRRIKDD